jgi:hypothetical protein
VDHFGVFNMQMISYINEIKRLLIDQYGFKEDPLCPGVPVDVPDGNYPMEIEGKIDYVRIEHGKINCCNFD